MSVIFGPKAAIYPFPPKPTPLSMDRKRFYREKVRRLLRKRDTVVVAHYYTDPEIQRLAGETGDRISNSLEMTRFGSKHPVFTLLVAGVRFVGETAKTLGPEETIPMPTLQAECSLGLSCPIDASDVFYDAHPDHTVVVYINTSTAIKARTDWIIISNIAVRLIEHLDSPGEEIIWAPSRHLGNYVQKQTGANVLCRQGAYIVHSGFKTQALTRMKGLYPDAAVLVHSESPQSIIDMAGAIDSTSQLVNAAKSLPHQQPIVATDRGILYKVQQTVPDKELLKTSTADEGATCRSCMHCPWIAMDGLKTIAEGLEQGEAVHEIHVDAVLREGALLPLNRTLGFATTLRA